MKPSIGRIVRYVLSEGDCNAVNRRRVLGAGHGQGWPRGAQAHVGRHVSAGEHVPMIVCSVSTDDTSTVYGQAFLDGNDSLWLGSVKEGTESGTWHWPERVE